MSSKKGVGIAPLVTGIFLVGQSLRQLLQSGHSLWAAVSFVGGCAAILVGAGILLKWGEFGTETNESSDLSTTILAGIALLSFVVGVAVVVV